MSEGMYTVSTEAQQGRTYENKKGGGNLTVWRLGLKDAESAAADNLFELHMKEGNTPPGVGEAIEVDRFFPGEFQGEGFTRIKRAYNPAPGSPSSSGSGDGGKFDRRPEHPRNEARMIHTSAHGASNVTPIINQAMALGIQPAPKDWDEYWALYDRIGERNARSYEKALRGTETPPATPVQPQLNGGEVPADTEGLQPAGAPAPDGDDLPF